MSFSVGDIVAFHSYIAGKRKYHLCVLEIENKQAAAFLFLNSKDRFKGNFVLEDAEVPCLPKSPTGNTVISCAMLVRANAHQLEREKAEKLGTISVAVAKKLRNFVETVPTLTEDERKIVLKALTKIIGKT